jgi:N-acetylmuramoyl-L-alanine amidase
MPSRLFDPAARLACIRQACLLLLVAPMPARGFVPAAPIGLDPQTAQDAGPGDSASRLEAAGQVRAALEATPRAQRTRAQYAGAVEAYRALYRQNPGDPETPEAIAAAAALLTEEGRLFRDETLLLHAIGEYELLRQQYPDSPYRTGALLHEGDLYSHDLHDRMAAECALTEFLQDYPDSQFVLEARSRLRALRLQDSASWKPATAIAACSPDTARPAQPSGADMAPAPPPAHNAGRSEVREGTFAQEQAVESPAPPPAAYAVPVRSGPLPLVTGVRHWSTPVYTRVAIDLGAEVQYQAARVPNPDRIYFDLYGARLAPELIGRTTPVTDDGFLRRIRVAQYSNNVTRIVLDVSQVSEYSAFFLPNPWRLIIDVHGSRNGAAPQDRAGAASSAPQGTAEIASLGSAPQRVQATRHPTTEPIAASVAGTLPATQPRRQIALAPGSATASVATHGGHSVAPTKSAEAAELDALATRQANAAAAPRDRKPQSAATAEDAPLPVGREAAPTADGQRSLVRALGLKIGRIVIDAGHGGHDSGTLGPGGLEEKDVALDVALRLGRLLRRRLGADVIYTRDTDTFVPLETRTAIANKAQADLFISIHANSSPDPDARGVETYYLNFTTSPDALDVAARENAVSDASIHQLSDLVRKIALKDKIDESREFAFDVNQALYSGLESGNPGLHDRGVKKAPFVVLIGANMPSILAEISFLTNPGDASELRSAAYRERIAESLYRGVARYIDGLSGVRLAQTSTHSQGGE